MKNLWSVLLPGALTKIAKNLLDVKKNVYPNPLTINKILTKYGTGMGNQ